MLPKIKIADYSYPLPDERIAKFPLAKRDSSKLLIYKDGDISEDVFSNLGQHISEGSLLVFNNTRVIRARLKFKRATGAEIEILCLEPYEPTDYTLSLGAKNGCTWRCIVGNLKRWKEVELSLSFIYNDKSYTLSAKKLAAHEGSVVVSFSWSCPDLSFVEVLEFCGAIPIPPYLNREPQDSDNEQYQTLYSKYNGSVAAPTAGLHFTPDVITSLSAKNIQTDEVTLHIGAGTFKPVRTETVGAHEMHAEHFSISLQTLKNIRNHLGKVVAVGTTTVRTLESVYYIGIKLLTTNLPDTHIGQWEPYAMEILSQKYPALLVFDTLINYLENNNLKEILAATQIMIAPPCRLKVINGIVTNFHQPRSTLLLLVSAVVGNKWKDIYDYALRNDFRFLSYGDSSLIMVPPADKQQS
ncbi:MAG: S-adenosylmethionine:tRNA ribosyltransferase-isomerase [Prevotellaceae bacterium]|jgi:S-adenosylmethionine:tRNA ribosyltransferase-isomerase|nr:S-adenosylmethionine:tRNA ribosyltransferase-isomerase [Prevotellaceae bacterium]